mmetsp:Transcript_20240/g.37607  ORF Transcript_20240/g.37607 Transcript_20240/m.37607 type:complete len:352 (-) Transcript_20240:51-1106(-)
MAQENELAQRAAEEVVSAAARIQGHVYRTPLQRAVWLQKNPTADTKGPARVFIKLESEQVTNSFKARGAVNKLLALKEAGPLRKVVTASTGNHALAVTYAAQRVGGAKPQFQIVLPENASKAKVDMLEALGAPLRFSGKNCLEAEIEAIRVAQEDGLEYISPYNDIHVLAGQGTIAVEVLEQVRELGLSESSLDYVFVPVGGGGLISGIAAYMKAHSPLTKVVGCGPRNDAHMGRSIASGALIPSDSYLENGGETLSEGTAGAIEPGSVTFPLCQRTVDEWLELSEEEVGRACFDMLNMHHKAVEGAAGLGIAGCRQKAATGKLAGKSVAIIICGGNVKATMVRDLLNKYL